MRIKIIVTMVILSSAFMIQSCGKEKRNAADVGADHAVEANQEVVADTTIGETDDQDETDQQNETNHQDETNQQNETNHQDGTDDQKETENQKKAAGNDTQTNEKETTVTPELSSGIGSGMLKFVDVFGQEYEVEINPNVEKHPYELNQFVREGEKLSYQDGRFTSRLGVDVSHHQGKVDWQKVKAAGYDFVILRLGYRGYGASGTIALDREFEKNVESAKNAGLEVGVYFFAQAINETEAIEEADFVLDHLSGHAITLPVVYDPESILDDEARTDHVTGEQFTKNTAAFCKRIEEAGYQPMIYSNMLWEAYHLNLEELADYPIWYADYEALPQTPYQFDYWQYTNEGRVDGISGNVDLNIQLIEK